MATPKDIDAKNLNTFNIEVGIVDNSLEIFVNPDIGPAGHGKVTFGNAGTFNNYDTEFSITDVLNMLKGKGAKSVFLAASAQNFQGPGRIQFELEVNGSTVETVDVNLPTWESQMWAYNIILA